MSDADTAVLIVGEAAPCASLREILIFLDFSVVYTTDLTDWQSTLAERVPLDVVLLAGAVDDAVCMDIINAVRSRDANIPVIRVLSGHDEAIPSRAVIDNTFAQLTPPLRLPQFSDVMHRAQLYRLRREDNGDTAQNSELFRCLVGNSRAIRRIRTMIEQVADSAATVLILGESGTGKEVVARNLHYHSSRRDKAFVPINCGAIPADLLESELFGHEKGAFTGAISSRQGRFELAENGTLFLDEIGDMSLPMQVKLLRVLQERTFERVGSNKSIVANVRIVAATHRNLEQSIHDGRFREDLFYRLNVFPIDMPPLRDRVEDIPLLLSELVSRLEHQKRGSVRLTPAAMISLCQYRWPGNVRELSNLIERLVIMHPYCVVDVDDLPEKFQVKKTGCVKQDVDVGSIERALESISAVDNSALQNAGTPNLPSEGIDLKEYLADVEQHFINQALDNTAGVVAHAAKLLKMQRTTLVEKMRKYGIQRTEEAS